MVRVSVSVSKGRGLSWGGGVGLIRPPETDRVLRHKTDQL